ncbi:MAG: GntR family transcriptional regulator [Lachnospiraceae bacterium]|nr:GntR family transcriptional regulator [Lachnospiraceae bacterium]
MVVDERKPGESASDYAFRVLKQNIVSVALKPGMLVSENDLASSLGLSRTPVREALNELAKVSVVETYPQRGTFIAKIDPEMVEDSRFLRKILDEAVIKLACRETDPLILKKLEDNVDLQEFYLTKENTEKIRDLDDRFHKLLYDAAKKEFIFDMRSGVMIHFDRVRTLSMETIKDMKIVADHKNMLAAVKEHDEEKAVALVEKHLSRYSFDAEVIKARYPEYFK